MFVEIYPNNKSICQYSDDCFSSIKNYNSCQLWDEKGNELIVVLDTNTRNHAVYERLGNIYCLEERFDLYSIVDSIDGEFAEHNAAIRDMLVNEALAQGFPLRCEDAIPTWPMPYAEFKRLHYTGDGIFQTVWGYWGDSDWDCGNTSYMYQELGDVIEAIKRTNPVDVVKDHGRLPEEDERVAIRVHLDDYKNGNPSSGPDGYAVWNGSEWDLSDLNVVTETALN
jgi:hypothetical protein